MSQPMPVVRQMYWPALIPQVIAIALLAVPVYFFIPSLDIPTLDIARIAFIAALAYLLICRLLRATLACDHTRGIRAYKAGRFQEAIQHFQASREFFLKHRGLDAWRSFIFGVASYNPYRVIALANMAYCHGQLGEADQAIELYEQVLRESPHHAVAITSLRLLKAVPSKGGEVS